MINQPKRTVHYTELPEGGPNLVLRTEYNLYRKEVGRWLKEGKEGKFVLIKGETVLGFFESWDEARLAGLKQFLLEPFLVHQVLEEEPVLRFRGYLV